MMALATGPDRPIPSAAAGPAQAGAAAGPSPDSIDRGGNGAGSDGVPFHNVSSATTEAAPVDHDISLGDVGGARLLLSDVRVALLLLDEARYRAVHRLFGVSREQSWPVTVIGLVLLADAAHDKLGPLLTGPGGPTRGDAVLGAAVLRELLVGIPGPSSRDTPLIGTVTMIAVLGAVARPGLSRAAHGIRASSHRVKLAFNHRYGHLLPTRRSRSATLQEP